MGEPVEELTRVEIEVCCDLRKLIERSSVLSLQNVDKVGDKLLVQRDAVAENLKSVLACVGVGRGRFALARLGEIIRLMSQKLHFPHLQSIIFNKISQSDGKINKKQGESR